MYSEIVFHFITASALRTRMQFLKPIDPPSLPDYDASEDSLNTLFPILFQKNPSGFLKALVTLFKTSHSDSASFSQPDPLRSIYSEILLTISDIELL